MELNKILDCAIMQDETAKASGLKCGYVINGRTYDNYLSNDCFERFVEDMKNNHETAYKMYGEGSGNELEIRKGRGGVLYPPKMASFGSSSRMIYNLLKDVDGFLFEKKLPTTVGGTANLDGFMETESKCIFVEAKCREPYTEKQNRYDWKYKDLYNYISESALTNISCEIKGDESTDSKMLVAFKVNDELIEYFDMKQMISHLLGVATAFLKGKFGAKNIEFLYLLFNPVLINVAERNAKEEIYKIYKRTCKECNDVDFKNLFAVVIEFLKVEKGLGMNLNEDELVNRFSFKLCSQSDIRSFFE